MRFKWIMAAAMVFAATAVITWTAQSSKSPSRLLDLHELNLKVTKTEAKTRIKDVLGNSISAKKGYKLVMVTLQGNADRDCQTILNAGEFAAVYEEDGEIESQTSVALSCIEGFWGMTSQNQWVALYCKKTTPVEIKAAFSIPDGVSNFSVRYPAFAAGKAVLK